MDNSKVNTLFAFLLALQELKISHPEKLLVNLRHKINQDGFEYWENILEKRKRIFKKFAGSDLENKDQDFYNQLGDNVITADLRLTGAMGIPAPPDNTNCGIKENFLKEIVEKVLKNPSDRSLLQPLRDSLEKQSQKEQHQKQ